MENYWEAIEMCPHCDAENVYPMWDTETQGFVARCNYCGKQVMLCDECQHTVLQDGEPHNCDWCNDEGGVCHRNSSPIILTTYRDTEEEIVNFEVPKNWLRDYLLTNEYGTITEFLDWFSWKAARDVYFQAHKDKVILDEWEV